MKFIVVDDNDILYHNPLGPEKASALEDLLRSARCFSPSFVGADPYSIENYVVQLARHRTEVTFLLDRNIYSQALALAKGVPVTEKTRVAAGIMAFASSANAHIEPNLALYEGSSSDVQGDWKSDLSLFHDADKIHAANWAALALGYAQKFDRKIPGCRLLSESAQNFNPTTRLRSFRFVYPILLKMANIARCGGGSDSKMIAFIDWMYHSWRFSAPAMMLASLVLSHDPPKRVFKNIGSQDRLLAIKGVRNAAWDLVYVTEWLKKTRSQSETNKLAVICSRDEVLLKVSELLRKVLFEEEEISLLRKAGFGITVLNKFAAYTSDLQNSKRSIVASTQDFADYEKQLISDLELELLRPFLDRVETHPYQPPPPSVLA